MSYLVLARKYRPQNFEDMIGQDAIAKTLRNALLHNRISSSYIFCGPRGTGKTTCARILSKAINCVNGPTATPCSECPACLDIMSGNSLDVLEIDAASNTGVDDIRTLRENVRYLPSKGQKRIYIIDEVHRLSPNAFDALLKTLEEPPAHVLFIFATTDPLKVPETILSRTQRFDFRRVNVEVLSANLKRICKLEGVDASDTALRLLARKADGSVRDSLSLLDQVIAYADNQITDVTVQEALSLLDRGLFFEFVNAVHEKNRKKVLDIAARVFDSGTDSEDFLKELSEHIRVLLILNGDENNASLLAFTESELNEFIQQSRLFPVGDLIRFITIIMETILALKENLDPRLMLELTGLRMLELDSTILLSDVLSSLQSGSLENNPSPQPSNKPQIGRTPETTSAKARLPESHGPITNRQVGVEEVKAEWKSYLGALGRVHPMAASQVSLAEIREVSDNKIHSVFDSTGRAAHQLANRADNYSVISRTLREHFRANLSIHFELSEPSVSSDQTAADTNPITQSERLKKLMQQVDGEIIGIRKFDN